MTSKESDQAAPVPLARALEDHSAEGAEILFSTPSALIKRSIMTMMATVVALIIWAFVGRADIVVSAPGVLSPEDDVRRLYSPAEGELENILVAEGDPISEGDPVARIRSQQAVSLAVQARQAELQLAQVELEIEQFPATLSLLQQEVDLLASDIASKQERWDARVLSGSASRQQEQRARLQAARGNLEKAASERTAAKRRWDSLRQISGEGVAAIEVEQARIAYDQAVSELQLAEVNLRALESAFIEETAQDSSNLEEERIAIENARIAHARKLMELQQAEEKLNLRLADARAQAQALRRIRVETTENDSILIIMSPVSGIVTQVSFTQAGDKVAPDVPLATVAPVGSRKVVKLDIAEQDGGFLIEGAEVRMKFHAFPYQQHGFIEGTLEYISPTTQRATPQAPPVYKGVVSLETDHFVVRERVKPIRYGMSAIAEIVVRERRLVDIALDPLRG